MRSLVNDILRDDPAATEAAAIVRSCVHCGFCNATCPTYQLTGDELDGPRGRIYLMKSWLEANDAGDITQTHLDRCLLCRSCETTCPSGVRYGRLLELVRPRVHAAVGQSRWQRLTRALLTSVIPYPRRWRAAVTVGRWLRPILPQAITRLYALSDPPPAFVPARHARRVLLLGGCAQSVLNPAIDAAATRVFDSLGITLERLPGVDCCGALPYHLGDEPVAVKIAKANIDAWWPAIEAGAEAVMATSSGCGLQLRDYGQLLAKDAHYGPRASRLVSLVRDPLELVDGAQLRTRVTGKGRRVAVQTPCTLQHGQRLGGRIEPLLRDLGWEVLPALDAHLCCGSAGSYSVLQPGMAGQLRTRKLANLMAKAPQEIVTANIGCQLHLSAQARVPVRHWLEVLAAALN